MGNRRWTKPCFASWSSPSPNFEPHIPQHYHGSKDSIHNNTVDMQRVRQYERPTGDGSRTLIIHDAAPREGHPADPNAISDPEDRQGEPDERENGPNGPTPRLTLNLQGGGGVKRTRKSGQRVVWKEDVVDNEGCGKKKTKICCIYHRPKRFDESSDESSDGSDCEGHDHDHSHGSSQQAGSSSNATVSTSGTVTSLQRPEPNAYEVQHRHHPRPNPQS